MSKMESMIAECQVLPGYSQVRERLENLKELNFHQDARESTRLYMHSVSTKNPHHTRHSRHGLLPTKYHHGLSATALYHWISGTAHGLIKTLCSQITCVCPDHHEAPWTM